MGIILGLCGAGFYFAELRRITICIKKNKRRFNGRLDNGKLITKNFNPLPEWKNALARYLNEIDVQFYEHNRNWRRRLYWQQFYLSYAEKVSRLPHYLSG